MMKILSRIRFLPVTIFAASMLLTVKIGDIWSGIDGLVNGGIEVSGAVAQTADQEATARPVAPTEATAQPAEAPPAEAPPAEAPPAEAQAAGDKPGAAAKPAAAGGKEPVSKMITEDPTLLTPAEIDLLQQLAERRRVLESREQELQIRTGLLSAAESRIDRKIEELKVLRETISGLIKTFDEQQDKKLLSLVKIYENMKPKDAARIFEDLEMDTLLDVAERMKERKLAPIMAAMNPEKAREVTVELARLRNLPLAQAQPPVGG